MNQRFAAFQSYEYNPWLISLASKFLLNDKNFMSQMIAKNPFEDLSPPKYVKADLYQHNYSKLDVKSENGGDERLWESIYHRLVCSMWNSM